MTDPRPAMAREAPTALTRPLVWIARARLAVLAALAVIPAAAPEHAHALEAEQVRRIEVDISKAGKPLDRSFAFSVGADYPGTLIRPEGLAQLKTAVDDLGFRYIRFHAIFHDVLGTVRVEDGKTRYDRTKIDQLYDGLLGMGIKPFVELGFTPEAMAISKQMIFYWKGNTSHPDSAEPPRTCERAREKRC